MKYHSPIELESIQQSIAGNDQRALKALYDHYGERFFHLAYAILHSREMAEEVVADVLIQVWKKRARIGTIDNFFFYLYITTRNISISYLRKYQHKKHINLDELTTPYYQLDTTPEDLMITGEAIQRINQAINDLPPKCRLIFKLVKEDGLKYKEVATLLHIDPKTVENQVGIALKKVHASIKIHLPRPLRSSY